MTAKLTQTAKTFRKEASAPQGDGTAPQRGYACRKSARMKRHRNETDKERKKMANSIFIKADELAKELDISQGLAYKMIAKWNEELKAKGYTTVGGRVSRRYYQEKIYGAGEE